eukprot:2928094-Pyramimonas_sp.AAC.1
MKAIVMRYLEPPHVILRKGLCAGACYPRLAEHVSEFMAATLFGTSRMAMADGEFRRAAAEGANPDMCALLLRQPLL